MAASARCTNYYDDFDRLLADPGVGDAISYDPYISIVLLKAGLDCEDEYLKSQRSAFESPLV